MRLPAGVEHVRLRGNHSSLGDSVLCSGPEMFLVREVFADPLSTTERTENRVEQRRRMGE